MVGAVAIGVLVFLGFVVKQIFGSLISQEIKGSIPVFTVHQARSAAALLPTELAARYLEEWLAELESLDQRPLKALKYAIGLREASRGIAGTAGAPVDRTWLGRATERGVDVVASSAAITFFAPLFFALSVLVRLAAGRGAPVLHRRLAVGKDGVLFWGFEFAWETMAGRQGSPWRRSCAFAVRRACLHVLPQLFNILRGDMSLIGPNLRYVPTMYYHGPALLDHVDRTAIPRTRPGLTCWELLAAAGQITLAPDEARRRDQNRNLRQDLVLVGVTILTLARSPLEI